MPRLTDDIEDCALYLYESHIDAKRGEKAGGSGFLYEIPFDESSLGGKGHLYAVSNWHVVKRAPVIRLNSANADGHKIIRKKTSDWIRHPDEQTDIAVCPLADDLRADDRSLYTYKSISPGHMITPDRMLEYNIGIGDDTFVVGRFVNHDGVQRNQPSVRFGAIAQMPKEKIRTETGDQEAFLVEAKSIAGYSGSPVFTLISERRSPNYQHYEDIEPTELYIFLGIDCGHIIDRQPVYNADGTRSDRYIESNTGMAIVAAAWKLAELLEMDALKKVRAQAFRKRQMEKVAVEDFAEVPRQRTHANNPDDRIEIPIPTEKQFSGDLEKAIRRKKKP